MAVDKVNESINVFLASTTFHSMVIMLNGWSKIVKNVSLDLNKCDFMFDLVFDELLRSKERFRLYRT